MTCHLVSLALILALTSCTTLESRAISRKQQRDRWYSMVLHGEMTSADRDELIRAQGDLTKVEGK